VITIAHTATVPPDVSGFILHDDNVVIPPRSGIRLRVLPPAARFDIDDVPAAAEESEQPVLEVDNNEVVIDGVKLDSNSPSSKLWLQHVNHLPFLVVVERQSALSVFGIISKPRS
jgi:hypothetical protein